MGKYDIDRSWLQNEGTSHAKILKSIKPGSVVLEFGSAGGAMTEYMQSELGCNIYIVEICEEDFSKAICFAGDGVCGDASDLEWLNKFSSMRFDYILFSDVLEHLYDPDVVLKHAISLLKDDGRVLMSVSNIAHSSIIIDLLQNKFEYKQHGLLDSTHIRFFTYHSLIEMINSAGLVTTVEDATYLQPFQTEFGNDYSDASNNSNLLKKKYFGNVYQFVFEMIKKEYFETHKNSISIENKITHNSLFSSMLANIFFDTGNGFNEVEIATVSYSSEHKFYYQANLAPDIQCVRFVPVEGMPCIVENIRVISDRGILEAVNLNGYSISDYHIFIAKDPQFDIKIPRGASWLSIEANVFPCTEPMMPGFFAAVNRKIAQKDAELGNIAIAIAEKDAELGNKAIAIAERDMRLANKDATIQQKDAEIANKQNELNHKQHEHDTAIMHLQAIRNAFWWRITKPARLLTGCAKWMLKHFPLTRAMYRGLIRLRHGSVDNTELPGGQDRRTQGEPIVTIQESYIHPEQHKSAEHAESEKHVEYDFSKYGADIDDDYPLVSIIMPCHNDGEYIHEAIDSALAQTYPSIELVIVNDASTDPLTNEILSSLSHPRITILDNKVTKRPSGARNRGIAQAKGKYILPLDADDKIEESYISKAVDVIEGNSNIGAVYCRADLFGLETGRWALPDYSIENMLLDNIVFVTALFRKDDWEKVGGFSEVFEAGMEDYDFWLSILKLGREIFQIPEILFHYRVKQISRTTEFLDNTETIKETYKYIYYRHRNFFGEHMDTYTVQLRNALINQMHHNHELYNTHK